MRCTMKYKSVIGNQKRNKKNEAHSEKGVKNRGSTAVAK